MKIRMEHSWGKGKKGNYAQWENERKVESESALPIYWGKRLERISSNPSTHIVSRYEKNHVRKKKTTFASKGGKKRKSCKVQQKERGGLSGGVRN